MNWITRILSSRRLRDRDLADEIRAHLEEKTDELMAQGISPARARSAARRAFGNVTQIEERGREVWRWQWLESLQMDVRHSFRLMRRHPSFSANVIVICALGVALCATTFSLVSGILLSPLPFHEPDRVFEVGVQPKGGATSMALPVETYLHIASGSPVIGSIAATAPFAATIVGTGEPTRLRGRRVTASFFQVFGVAPVAGRAFTSDEAEHDAPVVILGNTYWRSRFGDETNVVGRTISLNNVSYTIIGIMPARFQAEYSVDPDVWVPMRVNQSASVSVNAVVRIADYVTTEQAAAGIAALKGRMLSRATGDSVDAVPQLIPVATQLYGDVEQSLHLLFGAVLLVLALVSANVATMFLARTSARNRELGVRRAVGATAARQVRQLVTESTVLTAIGGFVGIMMCYWTVGALRGLGAHVLPRMNEVSIDPRVLAFAAVATVLMGIAGGLVPALLSTRAVSLGSPAAGSRVSSTLVMVQVTFSVVLLVGAGLLVKSFLRVLPSNPGFETVNRATLQVSLAGNAAFRDSTHQSAREFVRATTAAMRTIPGVMDAGAMSFVPFSGNASISNVELQGSPTPARPLRAYENVVTPNLLGVLGIRITTGRDFNASDDARAPRVAIVNQSAAVRWWPGENPVGKVVILEGSERRVTTVVGVATDARLTGTDTRIRPEIYLPVDQDNPEFVSFVVHTSINPRLIEHDLKQAVWRFAPRTPIGAVGTLESVALDSVRRERFFAWAMAVFAVVALVLSALGIHGLLAFGVAERRREIGIRLAMGATPVGVARIVLARAAMLSGVSVVLGLVLARALARFLESVLLETSATDATVFLGAAVVAVGVATIAACAPAYSALRVDPIQSLRQ